jgi:hypothetical protein
MKSQEHKTIKRKLLLFLVGLLWLGGCSGGNVSWWGPSALDQDYGSARRNNLAQTVLNPGAGKTNIPATGLEPNAGVGELERYDKSFKEEKKAEMKATY